MKLECNGEVRTGNTNLGVIDIQILFKDMKLKEITKGLNVGREVQVPSPGVAQY